MAIEIMIVAEIHYHQPITWSCHMFLNHLYLSSTNI